MISGISSGGEGLGAISSLLQTQSARATSGSGELYGLSGGEGASASPSATATISGPGQLLANLHQLQTQDPTKFKQVLTDIATKLQDASSQAQGPQAQFLSKLADKFQSVASTGDLSQLYPQKHQHHQPVANQAYGAASQPQAQGVASLAQSSQASASTGVDLKQLFDSITTEVSKAVGA